MILNPGTQHFDFDDQTNPPHIPIVVNSLAPSASGSPTDLNNNPAADTDGD